MAAFIPDSDSEDELPPLWEERATVDGSVYYVNHTTRLTQWAHPRTGLKKVVSGELPLGWEKTVLEDGNIIYVDHQNRRTTYADPRLAFAKEEITSKVRQRFDGSTAALQVLHGKDLRGKTAVITGANTGIGFETARSLALHGCHTIFGCRDSEKANDAISKIKKERSAVECSALPLDLESLESVKLFVASVAEISSQVNFLILNAGVFGLPFKLTKDGYEQTFQVNHLSHFYLTTLMEPLMAPQARVIVLSSESHRFANLTSPLQQAELSPTSSSGFWSMQAYNNSKLCNVLFVVELARRWADKGVCVFAVHPGNMVGSSLSRNWWVYRLVFALVRPFTKSLQQAASTTLFCAIAPELDGCTGMYFNNCWRCEPAVAAQDTDLATQLWNICEAMVKSCIP